MLQHSLVDDIFVGSFSDNDLETLMDTMTKGLAKGKFELEEWTVSGQKADKVILIGSNCDIEENYAGQLGTIWISELDSYMIPFSINVTPKCRGARDMKFQIENP